MSIHTSSLLFPWARHSAGVKVPTFHWSGQEGTQVPRKHPEEGEYRPQHWPAEVYLNVFSVSQNRKTEAGCGQSLARLLFSFLSAPML